MLDGKLALVATAAVLALAAPAAAVRLEPVVTDGLALPTSVTGAPGDDGRLYVTEKDGRVRVIRDGALQAAPFLDVHERVDPTREGGLLSLAFPPDHRRTGLFYVFLAVPAPVGNDIVIEERRLDACSPDRADPAYARETIRIAHHQQHNHNGGQLQFGPDGALWFGVGDGGGNYDPENDAADPSVGLGKLHRLVPTPGGGHTIPAGSPFPGSTVWAYGLRNPWRSSFDRATGDLWIGDVGQGHEPHPQTGLLYENIEEVDVLRAADGLTPGANFGWNRFEGHRDYGSGPPPGDYVPPVITVDGATGADSMTGGVVIRDPALEWAGQYVYGDFGSGAIRRADAADPTTTDAATPLHVAQLVSFGEDWSGRVYALSFAGALYRLVSDAGANGPVRPADPAGGCATTPAPTPPTTTTQEAPPPLPALAAPTVLPDRAAPRLNTTIARRQRLRGRSLLVRARCDEPCRLTVRGRVGAVTIRAVARTLRAGAPATVRLRLGPKALAVVRRSRRPRATLTLRATDAAGNVTRRSVRVVLARG